MAAALYVFTLICGELRFSEDPFGFVVVAVLTWLQIMCCHFGCRRYGMTNYRNGLQLTTMDRL